MKKVSYLIGLIIALSLSSISANAQLIDIKPWHGYYPEMGGDYPLSFVSFKGWLFPRPHFFVRYWPTHYYMEVGALPVSASPAAMAAPSASELPGTAPPAPASTAKRNNFV